VRALDAPSSASLQKDALRPADAGGAPVGGGSVAPAQKAPSAAPAARPAQPPAAEMVATTRALPREAADAAAGAAGELAVAAPGAPARSLSAPGVPSDDDPRTMILSALTPAGTRKLSIPLPVRARNEGTIEVRVRDASGDRELREAIRTAPDSTEITIDVPAAWLRAGRYEVELHSASGLLSRTGLTAR
jgi:hypothetical protein